MQVRGQEKLCMAAQGGMQGKGWHTLLLCGGVLLSSSFRCLRVSLFVPLGYLAANGLPLSAGREFETVSVSPVNGNAKVGKTFVSSNLP